MNQSPIIPWNSGNLESGLACLVTDESRDLSILEAGV